MRRTTRSLTRGSSGPWSAAFAGKGLVALSLCLMGLVSTVSAWSITRHGELGRQLRNPLQARRCETGSFTFELSCGSLHWKEGRCRLLPLALDGDTLYAWELVGSGVLELQIEDSLETLSARAGLGKRWSRLKLRRVCLLTRDKPEALADKPWESVQPLLPFLPQRPFHATRQLERLHPDNPLFWLDEDPAALWLSGDPGDLVLRQTTREWRLSRPLHEGSRIEEVITQRPRPREAAWLAPTFHSPPCVADSQWLEVEAIGERLSWTWHAFLRPGAGPCFVMLDPAARLESPAWLRGQEKARHPVSLEREGAWMVVERPDSSSSWSLELKGSLPRVRVREDSPRQLACSAADWFPRFPWWEPSLPTTLRDPQQVMGWGETWRGSLDGRGPSRLLPLPANGTRLTQDLTLCWTPLADQASRPRPMWTPPPRHTGDIADLELKRDREVRPPGHEEAAEPRDLAQGQDSLSSGMLGEDGGRELAWAAEQLSRWLGSPGFPVQLWERSHALGRDGERDRLLLKESPGLLPLEISTRDLRSAEAGARLRVLESLCLAWWEAPSPESFGEARWISLGAARACALRLLEWRNGVELPSRLREDALAAEGLSFQPKAFASLPWLGERCEGDWSSREVQDRMAWRLALVLEQLRWHLRDPGTLGDSLYLDLLAGWRERRGEAMSPRRPLEDLTTTLGGILVGGALLESSAFQTLPQLRSWLDHQWTQSALPAVLVESGRVEGPQGPRLALKVEWESSVPAGTVLPILVRGERGIESFTLRCTRQEESFLLPLDPAHVTGMEIAPGGSLPARVRTK